MLIIPININSIHYALQIDFVKEIIPVVNYSQIPDSVNYILGIINYRGYLCPLIDLNKLICNIETKFVLSSRIVILYLEKYEKYFGITVENLTETITINENKLQKINRNLSKSKVLDSIIEINGLVTQIIDPKAIYEQYIQNQEI
ncbi:hypothetical protein MASR1M45_06260 [Candidatus Kapaibacterium sp.]